MILLVIYAVPLMALTTPRVEVSDAFEWSDAAKLLMLAMIASSSGLYVVMRWYENPRWVGEFWAFGFTALAVWGLATVLWSALPSVTIDKAGQFGLMCVYASAIGRLVRTRRAIDDLLRHLTMAMLVMCGAIILCYVIDPEASGLDRVRIHTGGDGLVHPTAAGSTASLGILVVLLSHRLFGCRWAIRYAPAVGVLFGLTLLLSNSRMSLAMLLVVGGPMLWRMTTWTMWATIAVLGSAASMMVFLTDPGFVGIGSGLDGVSEYLMRGQDTRQLSAASGRVEMWTAIWNSYLNSPIVGHGWFVTSQDGNLYVWFEHANHLSHNIVLQVLSTTGLVGLAIFGTSILTMIAAIVRRYVGDQGDASVSSATARFAAFLLPWYAGWSLFSSSFVGPTRPETMIWFTMVGLLIAGKGVTEPIETGPIETDPIEMPGDSVDIEASSILSHY